MMTRTRFFAAILLVQAAILSLPDLGRAQTSPSAALTGRVSSQEEGPMEGVLVSAKRAGSTVTVTVVSDQQGRYSFPRNRLEPGRYALRIRAVGYDLEDPGLVEITAQKTTALDLKLRKTQNLAAQLTNAEWLLSAPGTEEQKKPLLNCVGCHTLELIVRSRHNTAEWMKVMQRMETYDSGSIPERPQLQHRDPGEAPPHVSATQAEYLSAINLRSGSQWKYPLKTLPRPKGKATRVIMTEYDLPREYAQPHDAVVDSEGMVWYCDFGQQYLGRLDPRTAKVVEYSMPLVRPGFPTGCRTVYFDPDGNVWLALQDQGAAGKFERKTQKFQTWSVPKGLDKETPRATGVIPRHVSVDGKVWVQTPRGRQSVRWLIQSLDVRSGEWSEPINVYRDIAKDSPAAKRRHSIYDILVDSQNNVYFTDYGAEYVGRMDAKTRKVNLYQTPTFDSGPRRGSVDAQDRLWFGEHRGNRIGMFDPTTERIQEWELPTPFSAPYDAVADKNGQAWAGGMTSDRIARLNTKTGEIVEYLLPRSTNIRKVDVDNSTNPVTFWVGNNHGASIVKLDLLE